MRRSIAIVIICLFTGFSLYSQGRIYIWSEIEPGWKTRSIEYWSTVKGYGKKVPLEMTHIIKEQFSQIEAKLDLILKEEFLKSGIPYTTVFPANPGSEVLTERDLFLDIQCSIMEYSSNYPWYRPSKLNIEPVLIYNLNLYNASGEIVLTKEVLDKVNYKYKIRPAVRSLSDHRRDIETVSQSFMESLSGPAIGKLTSMLSESITTHRSDMIEPDSRKFRQTVGLVFDNRRLHYPDEYKDVVFTVNAPKPPERENIIIQTTKTTDIQAVPAELTALIEAGHYYALLIGINEYSDYTVTDLDQPINDVDRLFGTLVNNYIFEEDYCTVLYNPTRDQIIESLDYLASKVTNNDNLLIFYAGHGLWDEQLRKGYWLPSDASAANRANWFSNSDLRDYIGGIKSRHTLVISDACFSGGIFKTREAFTNNSMATLELYKHPSRKAMTSGNMSMVPDKSVFVDYLIRRLEENSYYSLSSEQLYASFKIAVINNSATNQIPLYGEIRESGDEGGDFLFIRRLK